MVLGRVGEGVDAVLVDLDPVGHADRLADLRADFVEGGDGHRRCLGPPCEAGKPRAGDATASLFRGGGAQGMTSVPSGAAV